MTANKHIGSSFESFLQEEGLEEATRPTNSPVVEHDSDWYGEQVLLHGASTYCISTLEPDHYFCSVVHVLGGPSKREDFHAVLMGQLVQISDDLRKSKGVRDKAVLCVTTPSTHLLLLTRYAKELVLANITMTPYGDETPSTEYTSVELYDRHNKNHLYFTNSLELASQIEDLRANRDLVDMVKVIRI